MEEGLSTAKKKTGTDKFLSTGFEVFPPSLERGLRRKGYENNEKRSLLPFGGSALVSACVLRFRFQPRKGHLRLLVSFASGRALDNVFKLIEGPPPVPAIIVRRWV